MDTLMCVCVQVLGGVFCLPVCLWTPCQQYMLRPEAGFRSTGTGVQSVVNCHVSDSGGLRAQVSAWRRGSEPQASGKAKNLSNNSTTKQREMLQLSMRQAIWFVFFLNTLKLKTEIHQILSIKKIISLQYFNWKTFQKKCLLLYNFILNTPEITFSIHVS